MKKSILFISVLVGFGLASCETTPTPPHVPSVHMHAPTSGSNYNNGDTVFMDIHMTDDESLHEGYLYLRTSADTLFSFEPYVHDLLSYELDTFWVVNGISSMVNANVTVIAHNHDEGMATEDVAITLMP